MLLGSFLEYLHQLSSIIKPNQLKHCYLPEPRGSLVTWLTLFIFHPKNLIIVTEIVQQLAIIWQNIVLLEKYSWHDVIVLWLFRLETGHHGNHRSCSYEQFVTLWPRKIIQVMINNFQFYVFFLWYYMFFNASNFWSLVVTFRTWIPQICQYLFCLLRLNCVVPFCQTFLGRSHPNKTRLKSTIR